MFSTSKNMENIPSTMENNVENMSKAWFLCGKRKENLWKIQMQVLKHFCCNICTVCIQKVLILSTFVENMWINIFSVWTTLWKAWKTL